MPDFEWFFAPEQKVACDVEALHAESFELREHDLEGGDIAVHIRKKPDWA
jgi:hypothetical protein